MVLARIVVPKPISETVFTFVLIEGSEAVFLEVPTGELKSEKHNSAMITPHAKEKVFTPAMVVDRKLFFRLKVTIISPKILPFIG